ncbi:hypothetical protein HO173_010197 [Letharia columbiana]|uniref:DUF1772 domain-containing protein n=1 Tax=Letharia columbiana TaxID=112416 RepID=A0A8H6FNB3_9LECA|nr:uncharacterized protein HO173_010197 [Letharia columbiana]KAF6231665.1 hypothetical protein HO173_010197 [Letharia columbiana]
MASFLTTLLACPLALLSIYAGQKSYHAIMNLHSDQDRAEKAAEHSNKAARELWRIRLTQAGGAATVLLSLVSTLALVFLSAAPELLASVNVAAEISASLYISGYWRAKAEVPFMTEYNEAIRRSNDLRRLLIALSAGWAFTGAVGYLAT